MEGFGVSEGLAVEAFQGFQVSGYAVFESCPNP